MASHTVIPTLETSTSCQIVATVVQQCFIPHFESTNQKATEMAHVRRFLIRLLAHRHRSTLHTHLQVHGEGCNRALGSFCGTRCMSLCQPSAHDRSCMSPSRAPLHQFITLLHEASQHNASESRRYMQKSERLGHAGVQMCTANVSSHIPHKGQGNVVLSFGLSFLTAGVEDFFLPMPLQCRAIRRLRGKAQEPGRIH